MVPVEFLLFASTLLAVALFHRWTLWSALADRIIAPSGEKATLLTSEVWPKNSRCRESSFQRAKLLSRLPVRKTPSSSG